MSLEQPWWFLGLVVLPLLWLGAVRWTRTARAGARAYADPRLLRVGPSRRVAALRLAALLVGLTAVAAGPVALARPTTEAERRQEHSAVVLTIDTSDSMAKTDIAPTRLAAAVSAAGRFLDAAPAGLEVGLVTFADGATVRVTPTTDRARVRAVLAGGFTVREGTALGDAIVAGIGSLRASGLLDPPPATRADAAGRIVLLTDGDWSAGLDPAIATARARRLRVPVYTVLLGNDPARRGRTETPAQALQRISTETGGVFTRTSDGTDLSMIFRDLGRTLVRTPGRDDRGAWAIAAALALLAVGGGLWVVAGVLAGRERAGEELGLGSQSR